MMGGDDDDFYNFEILDPDGSGFYLDRLRAVIDRPGTYAGVSIQIAVFNSVLEPDESEIANLISSEGRSWAEEAAAGAFFANRSDEELSSGIVHASTSAGLYIGESETVVIALVDRGEDSTAVLALDSRRV